MIVYGFFKAQSLVISALLAIAQLHCISYLKSHLDDRSDVPTIMSESYGRFSEEVLQGSNQIS